MAKRKAGRTGTARRTARKQAPSTPSPDAAKVPARADSGRRSLVAALILLSIAASLPYWQVVGFDFLNYDDPLHVSAQPQVLAGLNGETLRWAITATPTNLWHPLTWWSFMAEVQWFGGGADAPGVHHIGNLLLHLANGVLFLLLLRALGVRLLVATAAALLFAMHPLHVEPVAWISARKDLLSSLFCLASLLAYVRYRATGAMPRWLLAFAAAAAAMAAKPSAVVLPVLLILLDFLPSGQGTQARSRSLPLRRLVLEKWPFFALALGATTVSIAVQIGGSLAPDIAGQGLLSRLMEIPAKLGFYLQRVLWPAGLTFEYASPEGARLLWLTAAGLAVLAAAGWLLTNTGSLDLTISSIEISWPAAQRFLTKLKLDGDEIWRGFKLPTSAVIDSGWNSNSARRLLPVGASSELLIAFSSRYTDDTDADYQITVHF
jgi:hypothetical protein